MKVQISTSVVVNDAIATVQNLRKFLMDDLSKYMKGKSAEFDPRNPVSKLKKENNVYIIHLLAEETDESSVIDIFKSWINSYKNNEIVLYKDKVIKLVVRSTTVKS